MDGASAISPILPSRLLLPVPPSVATDAPDAGQHGTATHDPAGGSPTPTGGSFVVHGAGVTDGAVPAEGVPIAATATEAGAVDAAVVARLSRMLHAFADGDAPAATAMAPLASPPGTAGGPGAPMHPGVNESALASWVAASGGAVALPAPAMPASRRSGVGRRPGSPEDQEGEPEGEPTGDQAADDRGDPQAGADGDARQG